MDDDPDAVAEPLPFYAATERALFELDTPNRHALRRRIRRSLRHGERWRLALDTCVTEVVGDCARSRGPDDGVWMSRR